MPHVQKISAGSLTCSGLHHSPLNRISFCQVQRETQAQGRVHRHLPFALCTWSSACFFTTAQREGQEDGYSSASHTWMDTCITYSLFKNADSAYLWKSESDILGVDISNFWVILMDAEVGSLTFFLFPPTTDTVCVCVCLCVYVCESCSVKSSSLQHHGLLPIRLLYPWNSPGENTRVGYNALLQGIFLTQGSNSGLPHCGQILYCLSHQGNRR